MKEEELYESGILSRLGRSKIIKSLAFGSILNAGVVFGDVIKHEYKHPITDQNGMVTHTEDRRIKLSVIGSTKVEKGKSNSYLVTVESEDDIDGLRLSVWNGDEFKEYELSTDVDNKKIIAFNYSASFDKDQTIIFQADVESQIQTPALTVTLDIDVDEPEVQFASSFNDVDDQGFLHFNGIDRNSDGSYAYDFTDPEQVVIAYFEAMNNRDFDLLNDLTFISTKMDYGLKGHMNDDAEKYREADRLYRELGQDFSNKELLNEVIVIAEEGVEKFAKQTHFMKYNMKHEKIRIDSSYSTNEVTKYEKDLEKIGFRIDEKLKLYYSKSSTKKILIKPYVSLVRSNDRWYIYGS